jgi:hypothetical protein
MGARNTLGANFTIVTRHFLVLFEEAPAHKSPPLECYVRRATAAAFNDLWATHSLAVSLQSPYGISASTWGTFDHNAKVYEEVGSARNHEHVVAF